MNTLALLQIDQTPTWVGPTIAISLAVIALSIVAAAVAAAIAALRLSGQARKIAEVVDGLQDDVAQAVKAARQLTEQAQDLMVPSGTRPAPMLRLVGGMRRKVVRGVDRIEGRLADLESLYNVVHDEVEDTALDVAAALRSVRRGNGMLGRVRRLLVASRR